MFYSFFNRFTFQKQPTTDTETSTENLFSENNLFQEVANQTDGIFYENFKLFHYSTSTLIDLLLFIPERGLYFGEKILWKPEYLKGANIERSSKRAQKSPSTQLEKNEWRIHQKLQDVLSFDSTPIERFFWMPYLTENDFDNLDPSFHELLPKTHLIFCDDPAKSILNKLESLLEQKNEPYSKVKIIGSLQSHTLLLPNSANPFGRLLSEEQWRFLDEPTRNETTQLCGDYGSGKSTLLLRKALQLFLDDPTRKILIITPTKLGGELLRDELVALIEYGALSVELSSFFFHTPEHKENIEFQKHLQEATHLFCDDADQIERDFISFLENHKNNRYLLFSSLESVNTACNVKLINHYRYDARHYLIHTHRKELISTLLNTLTKRLSNTPPSGIVVVIEDDYENIKKYKELIDEHFHLNCRILTPSFSLQYQNLDNLILSTPNCLCGVSIPHLYFISSDQQDDYPFILSRASETATIISYSNSDGDQDEQNHQE